MKKRYLFRFVPTMRCNFNCDYCFLGDSSARNKDNMFMHHSTEEWVNAMRNFSESEVEIYMWGGEPFLLDQTYDVLKAWLAMEHITDGCRIDTNIYFADKIAERCPSSKLKLNCSYHMQYHTLEQEVKKVKKLKELDMVGMVNFVASESNLKKLKNDYNMSVFDLIKLFSDINVFLNIAGDFSIANDVNNPRHDEYMDFILQFISPDEWEWLRGKNISRTCDAGKHFFTVDYEGNFTSCIKDNKIYGNFFDGHIRPDLFSAKCSKCCQSLVSYPFIKDNNYSPWKSLTEYVKRNEEYRKKITTQIDFEF